MKKLLPMRMKSQDSVILKLLISGVAMIHSGFPPFDYNFASASPKLRETESLPGRTLQGP